MPLDRSFEICWVRPAAHGRAGHGDDRVTLRRPRRRPARRAHGATPDGAPTPARWARRADAPPPRRGSASRATGFLGAARARPDPRRMARGCSGRRRRPARRRRSVAERDAVVVVGAPGGRVVDGDVPAVRPRSVEVRAGRPRARRPRSSCRSRSPSRGSTSSVDRAIRARLRGEGRASTSRSSTCRAASARTSSRSTPRKLEEGNERGLDATTTRTLMGTPTRRPGSTRKFFDHGHGPAGRGRPGHGRAATTPSASPARRKYYEDMGYPGHVNCSDNFNAAADARTRSPRARAGRRSTSSTTRAFDAHNLLLVGRAVVAAGRLRAAAGDDRPRLRLVAPAPTTSTPPTAGTPPTSTCASTRPENRFSTAIAHRVTPDAEPKLTKETGFHPSTSRAHRELHRVQRLLAAALLRQRGRDRPSTGPAARRPW